MKKLVNTLVFVLALLTGCSLFPRVGQPLIQGEIAEEEADQPDEALKQEFQKTRDVITNSIPGEKLWEARLYQQQMFSRHHKAALGGVNWTERGPNNVGGRTRAILWDKNDTTGKTVFAAGVSGGLWKTTNIFEDVVVWTKVDDFMDNIAICAIAQDPNKPDTIYVGTGEGFYNIDAVQGNGIYRSVDGGETFSPLSSTVTTNLATCAGSGNCNFMYVNKIVVTSTGTIIAACRGNYSNRGGIMRSSNFGVSFSRIIPSSSPFLGADVEISANGDIYAALGLTGSASSDNGIWKSTNDGASFTKVYTANANDRRIEIACAPSNSDYIYAITEESSTARARSVLRSTDGGSNWTNISVPVSVNGGDTFTKTQAWYNLLLTVDPKDEDKVIMGGIDIYKTTNGGSSWTQISEWTGANSLPDVHSDQHVAEFSGSSSDTVLIGNDGGLYLVKNYSASNPTFKNLNTGYNVTQFYSCAINPVRHKNEFLGGTQDNGTQQFTKPKMNETVEVFGGDGGFCHIDSDNPTYQFAAYTNSNLLRSTNGGKSFSYVVNNGNGKFINPTDYDSKSNIWYCGYSSGNYLRLSNMTGTISTSGVTAGFSGQVSAVTVDTFNTNVVYFGTDNGKVYRVTNANATPTVSNITPAGMSAGTYVTSIAIDRQDPAHLLATVSNYNTNNIFESANSGSSWTVVDGNLPNMPVRWAMFSPLGGDSALIATELGVWTTDSLNGANTIWGTSNNGLANVRVDMLRLRESDSLVIAATHGRGIYTSDVFSSAKANFESNKLLVYVGEEIQFTDDSYKATSWAWDFNNDGITDAFVQNPTYAFATAGMKTIKLTINGSLSTTKTDYIQVLPNMGTPYASSDGGDFDVNSTAYHFGSASVSGNVNLWERGVPANALNTASRSSSPNVWKTDLDADLVSGDYECALYTPNYNFTNSGTYTLSFDKSMEIYYCNAPVGVQVQYSTDKGLNWSRLGTTWYNKNPSSSCKMAAEVFPDFYGWIGNYSKSASSQNVSFLAGEPNVAFRIVLSVAPNYSAIGYAVDGFMVDNFQISGPANAPTPAGIETEISSQTRPLGGMDSVEFFSTNGKFIATIVNNSSHNYGNTTVEIDNAGIGTTNFSGNTTAERRIMNKTIKITPTNANSSGDVDITMYFNEVEIDSFETTTGNSKSSLNLIKTAGALLSTGTLANTIYGGSPIVSSHLTGSKVTANFTNGFSGVGSGLNGNSGPLPVTWLNFTGLRIDQMVKLNWQTASEFNNDGFEIYRMVDGEEDFTKVGLVNGNGTTNAISAYSFDDPILPWTEGKNMYYQLKQIDFDGQYDMSKVIVLYPDNSIQHISVYPNPGKDKINIEFGQYQGVQSNLEITDVTGKVVFTSVITENHQVINTKDLAAGVYWLTIYQNDVKVGQMKWVKGE